MKTRLHIVIVAVLFGCQVQPEPDPQTTVQAETTDCFGVANYCSATLPPEKPWAGQLPPSNATTAILIQQSPFVGGLWYAIGADWQAGQILWLVSFHDKDTVDVMKEVGSSNRAWAGIRPPPPPPPPTGVDPRFALASGFRVAAVAAGAAGDVAACKP